jgi:hypothetical protein
MVATVYAPFNYDTGTTYEKEMSEVITHTVPSGKYSIAKWFGLNGILTKNGNFLAQEFVTDNPISSGGADLASSSSASERTAYTATFDAFYKITGSWSISSSTGTPTGTFRVRDSLGNITFSVTLTGVNATSEAFTFYCFMTTGATFTLQKITGGQNQGITTSIIAMDSTKKAYSDYVLLSAGDVLGMKVIPNVDGSANNAYTASGCRVQIAEYDSIT